MTSRRKPCRTSLLLVGISARLQTSKITDSGLLDTKLADRAATLEAASPPRLIAVECASASPSPLPAKRGTANTAESRSSSPAQTEALARLRQDLSEAQRTKGEQQSRLKSVMEELERLKIKSRVDAQRISELATEKTGLVTRMRDRDEELKGKAKLLEVIVSLLASTYTHTDIILSQNVHDETVSLTLQLNMAEERSEKLQKENKELVDRWMARMSQEADAMNNASMFS